MNQIAALVSTPPFLHDTFAPDASLDVAPPPLVLLGTEPIRAALEYLALRMKPPSPSLPRGDGHAVVVFPGLAGDASSTLPLREFCSSLGYEPLDWGRGLNRGPSGDIHRYLDELAEHVDDLTAGHRRRISLIGWSLGGIYAREVAKKLPKRVRCVITLGAPFAGGPEHAHVGWLYRLLNGAQLNADEGLRQRLRVSPTVPTTSIYSRTDGVVAWQACLHAGSTPLGARSHLEDVEVPGSHLGLGWNAAAFDVIAQRLGRKPALAASLRGEKASTVAVAG